MICLLPFKKQVNQGKKDIFEQDRKSWSISIEDVWKPVFTATNAIGSTNINREAIGAPLRLSYAKDGSVKFSKTGKPVITVAKELNTAIKSVKEMFHLS